MSNKTRILSLIAGMILLFSNSVQALVVIDTSATGGDCATSGTWDPSNLTCTLSSDVFDTIIISGDGITLNCAGFTVQPDIVPGIRQGIVVAFFNNVSVKNCIIQNTIHGILYTNVLDGTIAGNTIRDSDPNIGGAMRIEQNSIGVVVKDNFLGPGPQQLLSLSNNCIVLNNTLDGTVFLVGGNDSLVQGNLITEGEIFVFGSDNIIKNNVISDSTRFGINLELPSTGNVIRNNQIFNTTGGQPAIVASFVGPGTVIEKNFIDGVDGAGIGLAGDTDGVVLNSNDIRNAGVGMSIFGQNHTLTGNDVRSSGTGLQIPNTATGFILEKNSFCDSSNVDIFDSGTNQTWNKNTCDTIAGAGNAVCKKTCK